MPLANEKEYRIGYVILHYQALEETRNCIESVLTISTKDDVIIVVDNCSVNHSGQQLKREYQNNEQIEIIINSSNEGFARGNNIGFIQAKKKYNCNIIILLNNDILINQSNFRQILLEEYELHQFDIAGPQILYKNGLVNHGSPSKPIHTSLMRIRIGEISNLIRYLLTFVNLDIWFGNIFDKNQTEKELYCENYIEDVQLAGCFLIFTPKYISIFDGLNPNTFMYLEEAILYTRAQKAKLVIAFDSKLQAIHLEDIATSEMFSGNSRKKRRFKYRCQMKSFKVLISEFRD